MAENLNHLNLDRKAYAGSTSTLCTGCGHDLISNHIISACYQSDISPYYLAKMSGIGCSSKTPAYFISSSFGFNSMHGRMAPVATGAKIVNTKVKYLGVSGDGDTASLGLSGFLHLVRRNLPMCYIVANNGVYGLTKGQFSATSDKGSSLKTGAKNTFESLDLCTLAIDSGCNFVARSFSGDAKQLVPLIEAGLRHKGTAFIDVISPCIAFNNHDGSTKSYSYVKEHDRVLQELGFIMPAQERIVDYAEGTVQEVELPDGSCLFLKKIKPMDLDVTDKIQALRLLQETHGKPELLTGLFYVNESTASLVENLNMVQKPLSHLQEADLRPTAKALHEVLREFR